MKQILILHPEVKTKQKKKLERELLWYDHSKQELKKFNGGKLVFENEYDEDLDEYRLLPKVAEVFETETKAIINKTGIKDWFSLYSTYNDTTASQVTTVENGVIFAVDEKEADSFTYDLERQNIRFMVL